VGAQAAGRIQDVFVRPGQTVRRGQLLVTVTRPELQSGVAAASATLRENELEVDALRADRISRASSIGALEQRARAAVDAAAAKSDLVHAGARREEIDRAQAALDTAESDLDRLKAGARPQEIAQAEAGVRDAKAALDAAQQNLTRKRSLLDKGFVSKQEVERAVAEFEAAKATHDARQEALNLLNAGARKEEISAQAARVREARAYLAQLKAGARPQEIREADAALAQARAESEQARLARLDLKTLDKRIRSAISKADASREALQSAAVAAARQQTVSPIDGMVSQVLVHPGDGVAEQSPLVVITNPGAFRAVLDIPAANRTFAQPGTAVEVTVPGVAGLKMQSTIRALLPETDVDTGLIHAEAWVSDPARRLAEGMTVEAKLVARQRPALLVPSRAVAAREGENLLFVIQDDVVHETPVEVGVEHKGETEILSGVKAGDKVVADGSLSLADGVKVTIEGAKK
jgi:RND family efflux transporter MFP subunit